MAVFRKVVEFFGQGRKLRGIEGSVPLLLLFLVGGGLCLSVGVCTEALDTDTCKQTLRSEEGFWSPFYFFGKKPCPEMVGGFCWRLFWRKFVRGGFRGSGF